MRREGDIFTKMYDFPTHFQTCNFYHPFSHLGPNAQSPPKLRWILNIVFLTIDSMLRIYCCFGLRESGFSASRGGTILYISYIGMCYRVWFLSRFGLKTGIGFDHYGMVFKGTAGAFKRICLFNSK